jgi:hypothetical protein
LARIVPQARCAAVENARANAARLWPVARTCRRCRRKIWLLAGSYLAVGLVALSLDPRAVAALLEPLGLLGIFATGVAYTYGFTSGAALFAAPALGLVDPPAIVGIVGGLGAALADTSILVFLREKMAREIREVSASRAMRWLGRIPLVGHPATRTILGIVVLASPFPDEIGVALVASNRLLSAGRFALLSFAANAVGLYGLAQLGRAVL